MSDKTRPLKTHPQLYLKASYTPGDYHQTKTTSFSYECSSVLIQPPALGRTEETSRAHPPGAHPPVSAGRGFLLFSACIQLSLLRASPAHSRPWHSKRTPPVGCLTSSHNSMRSNLYDKSVLTYITPTGCFSLVNL